MKADYSTQIILQVFAHAVSYRYPPALQHVAAAKDYFIKATLANPEAVRAMVRDGTETDWTLVLGTGLPDFTMESFLNEVDIDEKK